MTFIKMKGSKHVVQTTRITPSLEAKGMQEYNGSKAIRWYSEYSEYDTSHDVLCAFSFNATSTLRLLCRL